MQGYGRMDSGICLECADQNCLNCDGDNSSCILCDNGYARYVNETGSYCKPCEGDCWRCDPDDRSICQECRPGFANLSIADGLGGYTCKACPSNCKVCSDEFTCKTCSFGYGFKEGECKKCDSIVAGCVECEWKAKGTGLFSASQEMLCKKCKDGLGKKEKTGECLDCGDNCHKCDSAGLCDVCEPGFALGGAAHLESGVVTPEVKKGARHGDRCWRCADNCMTCDEAGPMKCDVCEVDYLLVNSTRLCEEAPK